MTHEAVEYSEHSQHVLDFSSGANEDSDFTLKGPIRVPETANGYVKQLMLYGWIIAVKDSTVVLWAHNKSNNMTRTIRKQHWTRYGNIFAVRLYTP